MHGFSSKLRCYREGGLEAMAGTQASLRSPTCNCTWAEATLTERSQQAQGFDGHQAICDWLENQLGVQAEYKTMHQLVYYRLPAAPEVPRSVSVEQSSDQLEAYKKLSLEPGNAGMGNHNSSGLEWQDSLLLWG